MKIAIVGSRSLVIDNLKPYLPEGITEIISGGARGIDTCAKEFAIMNQIKSNTQNLYRNTINMEKVLH